MNTQPRDKKGKFLKVRMNEQDWNKLLEDKHHYWTRACRNRDDEIRKLMAIIDHLKEENKSLMRSVGAYAGVAYKAQRINKKQTIALCLWTSLAFILGTIFFMIISKSK